MAGRRFSLGTPVSSTNKTDHHDITEILLKVALNTITSPPPFQSRDKSSALAFIRITQLENDHLTFFWVEDFFFLFL